MAIASINETFDRAAGAMKRFPVSILSVYVATILLLVANHYTKFENFIGGYVATAVFAFFFALAVDLFLESRKVKLLLKISSRAVVLVLVVAAYIFVFRLFNDWAVKDIMKFVLLNMSALSLVLFAPFITPGKMNGFWQFVIGLFVRFVQAFFLFGILYLGIAALMASLDYLFEIVIDGKYYFDVWLCIVGFLVTTFILAGIPSNFQALDRISAYPKFLRILTEYFLVPLVFLYLIVLYVYFGKILVTFVWPDGGVAWWIIGFSFVGVLSYFLAHSTKEKFMKHVEFFRQWFFVGLIPLLAVLFMAVYLRTSAYGITEPRYFVLMYGIWLLMLCVYYIFSRVRSLKFIPILLFGFLLFSSYGPQSVFDVSQWSQLNRLEKALTENGMLKDGKVVKADLNVVNQKSVQNIGSMVYYLVDHHGVEVLQPWFSEDLGGYYGEMNYVLDLMGLQNVYYDSFLGYDVSYSEDLYITFSRATCGFAYCTTSVSGFDEYIAFYVADYNGEAQFFSFADKNYEILFSGEKNEVLRLGESNCESCGGGAQIDLRVFLEDLILEFGSGFYNVPGDKMTFAFPGGEIRVENITAVFKRDPKGELNKDQEFVKVDYVSGILLLKKEGLIPPA